MLQSLAVDPVAPEEEDEHDGDGAGGSDAAFALLSAASDGAVIRWVIRRGAASSTAASPSAPALPLLTAEQRPPRALRPHPCAIYALAFLPTDAPDLVTASADGTCLALARDAGFATSATRFAHGGHVRGAAAGWGPDAKGGGKAAIVVTGGRDEDVCVWDANGGRRARFRGHFDEVLCVAVLPPGPGAPGKGRVVSAGLDGTVRCWGLDGLGEAEEEEEDRHRDRDGAAAAADAMGAGVPVMDQGEENVVGAAVGYEMAGDRVTEGRASAGDITTLITAEEQMELDAMMDDDPMG